MKSFLYLFLIHLFVIASHGITPPSIVISPNIATIGDLVTYDLAFTYPLDYELVSVPNSDLFLSNSSFELHDQSLNKQINPSSRTIEMTFEFFVFDTGTQQFSSQNIILRDPQTNRFQTIEIPPQSVLVKTTRETGSSTVILMKSFFKESLDWKPLLLYALIGLVLVLCLVVWIKKRHKAAKNITETHAPVDTKPPIEKAKESMTALYHKNLYASGEFKEHYLDYTDIIKTFLGSCFKENIVEMTSLEIYTIASQRLHENDSRRLKHLLDFSDLIKFAKQTPSLQDYQEGYDKAIDFFQRIDAHFNSSHTSEPTSKVVS